MYNSNNNPIEETARRQIKSLYATADEAYKDDQYLRAAEIYGQVVSIAKSIGAESDVVKSLFWRGSSLIHVGKLKQALGELGPVFQTYNTSANAEDIFNVMILYISIAISLPVALDVIEKSLTEAENFLQDAGNLYWRYNVLFHKSELLNKRGLYTEALKSAQESSTIHRRGYPVYVDYAHIIILVSISINMRDPEMAHKYLANLETPSSNPKQRECFVYLYKSMLARLERRINEATQWGRRAVLAGNLTEQEKIKEEGLNQLVRAFLAAGDVSRVREHLACHLRFRHSEKANIRFSAYLLCGDYHLAKARNSAGMDPADDEYGSEFPPPSRIVAVNETHRELVRAKRAYGVALKIGQMIDEKLHCIIRQQEISKRYARVQAIEEFL